MKWMWATIAKPKLMTLYKSQLSANHEFPLLIRMQVVPEMDSILNTKGCKYATSFACAKIHGIAQH